MFSQNNKIRHKGLIYGKEDVPRIARGKENTQKEYLGERINCDV